MEDGSYVEIKGFERKRDKYKWKVFPYTINILYATDLEGIFKYVKEKYGKDFIKLYESRYANG